MAVASLSALRQASHAPATVFVPGGRFLMGSAGRPDESPVHEVEVRPLRFGRTPVTNLEYAWFLSAGRAPEPPWWKDPDFWDPGQPVVGVTWFEAMAYCVWLVETIGGHWRLPTEAEWEHAVRGGLSQAPTAWGGPVPPGELAEPPLTGPWGVARGYANGYGLLDPGTVVREWCLDWHAVEAYRFGRRYDPRGPETGKQRVRRGGSWRAPALAACPSARDAADPLTRAADGGFRVAREVP
jgi:formylglycine-generating enzyme required for sulfatase activity